MADLALADEVHRVISTAVDGTFYRAVNPDLADANVDPIRHYADIGWREGRDPAPWFSSEDYLKTNPDIAIPLTQEFLKVKETADTKAAYEAYVKIYPDDLRPSIKGLQLVLNEIGQKSAKARAAKPEQLVDTSSLDALEREGFFKKLLGK